MPALPWLVGGGERDAGIWAKAPHLCVWSWVEDLPAPQTLQELQVPIMDQKTCQNLYNKDMGKALPRKDIQDDMMCAGYAEGMKDTCKVRLGGPRSPGPLRSPSWAHLPLPVLAPTISPRLQSLGPSVGKAVGH